MIIHKTFSSFVLFAFAACISVTGFSAQNNIDMKKKADFVLIKAVLSGKDAHGASKEEIISSPKVITTNGAEAKVIMADIHNWDDGSKDVLNGITLTVLPRIENGDIRLSGKLMIIFPIEGNSKGENSEGHWAYTHSFNVSFKVLVKYPQSSITLKPVKFGGTIYKLTLTANQIDVNGKLIAPGK